MLSFVLSRCARPIPFSFVIAFPLVNSTSELSLVVYLEDILLQIQKYRYKNQFTYQFDVDPDCLDYYCNKITLQPIIENAINHGLDLLVDEGVILVQVRQDGEDIVFSVQDNGVAAMIFIFIQRKCS